MKQIVQSVKLFTSKLNIFLHLGSSRFSSHSMNKKCHKITLRPVLPALPQSVGDCTFPNHAPSEEAGGGDVE